MSLSLIASGQTCVGNTLATWTQALATGNVGDICVVNVAYASSTIHVTGLTDNNSCFSWQLAAVPSSIGTYSSHGAETWYGVRTSTGTTTLDVAFSGSVSSTFVMLTTSQLRSGTFGTGTTWTVEGNFLGGASGATLASVTSYSSGAEQGYVGVEIDIGSGGSGGTSGFSYFNDSNGNEGAYNLSLATSTAYAPAITGSSGAASTAVIVSAGPTGVAQLQNVAAAGYTNAPVAQSITPTALNTLILFAVSYDPAVYVVGAGVSDSNRNKWYLGGYLTQLVSGTYCTYQVWVANSVAGAPTLVTFAPGTGAGDVSIVNVSEWSDGPLSVDQFVMTNATNTTATAGPITPTISGEGFIGFGNSQSNAQTFGTPSSPFTAMNVASDPFAAFAYYTESGTGAESVSWTQSGSGLYDSAMVALRTGGVAPSVTTGAAQTITPTSATLQATVNAGGLSTTYKFNWGTTSGYGNVTVVQGVGSGGTAALAQLIQLTGLTAGTTYHFQISATNSQGTTTGSDATFTTTTQGADWTPYLGDPSWFFNGPHEYDFFGFSDGLFYPPSSGAITAAISASMAVAATNTEQVALSAAVSPSLALAAANKQTIALTCAITATSAIAASSTEAVALSAASTPSLAVAGSVTELIALTAASAPSSAMAANNAEAVALTAPITASMAMAGAVSGSTPVTAAITASMAMSASNAEAVAVTASITATMAMAASNAEKAALTGAITSTMAMTANNAEAVALSSAITASSAMAASNAEAVALTAPITATSAMAANNTEAVALTAAVLASLTVAANLGGSTPITAAIASSLAMAATNAEAVALTCGITASMAMTAANGGSVPLTASISSSLAMAASNAETVNLASGIIASSVVASSVVAAVALTSAIGGTSAVAGSLTRAVLMTSSITASMAMAGASTMTGTLVSSISCTSAMAASNTERAVLTSSISASAAVTATVAVQAALNAQIVSSLVVTASFAHVVPLTSAIVATSSVGGVISVFTAFALGGTQAMTGTEQSVRLIPGQMQALY